MWNVSRRDVVVGGGGGGGGERERERSIHIDERGKKCRKELSVLCLLFDVLVQGDDRAEREKKRTRGRSVLTKKLVRKQQRITDKDKVSACRVGVG